MIYRLVVLGYGLSFNEMEIMHSKISVIWITNQIEIIVVGDKKTGNIYK